MEQSESIIKLETNTRKDVDLSASFFHVHWACQQARTKACCRAIRHTRYCLLSLMRHHVTPMILVMHHVLSHRKNSKDSKIYSKKQYNEYDTPEGVAQIHTIGLYICHPLWIHTHTPFQPKHHLSR